MKAALHKRGACWLALACGLATAQPVEPDNTAAYARIDAQRAQQNAQLDGQEAACYQRFVVNSCVADVRKRRIAMLKDLKTQETALHDAERAYQAAVQRQRAQDKAADQVEKQAQAARDAAELEAQDKPGALQAKQDEHAAKAASVQSLKTANDALVISPAARAENQASYARKQAEAEKKRQEIASRKRTGTPLPLPISRQ